MKRVVALLCFMSFPGAVQQMKIAAVSMLHAHVWLHLGTMLKGDKMKLVGVSETLPDLISRAQREDVIPQTQGVMRPVFPAQRYRWTNGGPAEVSPQMRVSEVITVRNSLRLIGLRYLVSVPSQKLSSSAKSVSGAPPPLSTLPLGRFRLAP